MHLGKEFTLQASLVLAVLSYKLLILLPAFFLLMKEGLSLGEGALVVRKRKLSHVGGDQGHDLAVRVKV